MGLGLLISDGYAAAVPMLRRSVEAVRASEEPSPEDLRWHVQCVQAAPLLWDDAGWMEIAELQLRRVRAVGATELLPAVLNARAAAHILAGEFPAARSLVREIEAVSEASGLPHTPYAEVAVPRMDRRGGVQAHRRQPADRQGPRRGTAHHLHADRQVGCCGTRRPFRRRGRRQDRLGAGRGGSLTRAHVRRRGRRCPLPGVHRPP
jgi:hypothetical protein